MLEAANSEIRRSLEDACRRQERAAGALRVRRAVDEILWVLEELNLEGTEKAPAGLAGAVREILAEVPGDPLRGLPSNEVQALMDAVFLAQARLVGAEEDPPEPGAA